MEGWTWTEAGSFVAASITAVLLPYVLISAGMYIMTAAVAFLHLSLLLQILSARNYRRQRDRWMELRTE